METIEFKSFHDLPYVLDMKELSVFLGISRAGAYNLLHRADFPTLHINSRLLVTKENLRSWMEMNTNGMMKQRNCHRLCRSPKEIAVAVCGSLSLAARRR